MKELFALRNTHTGKVDLTKTFASKFRAKEERDARNKAEPPDSGMKWVVTYGPDHHRYTPDT